MFLNRIFSLKLNEYFFIYRKLIVFNNSFYSNSLMKLDNLNRVLFFLTIHINLISETNLMF